MASAFKLYCFLFAFAVCVSANLVAQPIHPHGQDFDDRGQDVTDALQESEDAEDGQDVTNLLQETDDTKKTVNVRFTLGSNGEQDGPKVIEKKSDFILRNYWRTTDNALKEAGFSTPLPRAALVNAPPVPPTPLPWQTVMQDSAQPLNTKLGSAVVDTLLPKPTQTPPPTQKDTNLEFVAQCPMVLFDKNLSIRSSSCNDKMGSWLDTSANNPRVVLRWKPQEGGKVFFGIDSALSGEGAALFAMVKPFFTLASYKFELLNCLGTDRFHVQEEVTKIDSMGSRSSTIFLHDAISDSKAFFFKYLVRSPTGKLLAETNLFRMHADRVNFTEIVDGKNTGRLLAIAQRQGHWHKGGWHECMSATSPRGWSVYFPQNKKTFDTVATVQDIRVAIAAAVTLMAQRDEGRGSDGLNNAGQERQLLIFVGGILMVLVIGVLLVNCCMVFSASGLKLKLKNVLFESEGAFMPKAPANHRQPPLQATY